MKRAFKLQQLRLLPVSYPSRAFAAGRFECASCPHSGISAFEYFLVLVGTVLVNAFLIWRLLDEQCTGWGEANGSDYTEVWMHFTTV